MRIVHLCGGPPGGGAAKGVLNLHRSLVQSGIDSKVLFSMHGSDVTNLGREGFFYQSRLLDGLSRRLFPRIESIAVRISAGHKVWPYSLGFVGYPFLLSHPWVRDADVIHLHWVNAGFVSVQQIKEFSQPVVWTLRDEWPYTGGCHYSGTCKRSRDSCGKCPLLGASREYDLSRQVFLKKLELQGRGINYIAISHWIQERARASSLLRNERVDVIINGIDQIFLSENNKSKMDCRKEFGFDSNEKILLCGATNLDSPFKGYSVLRKFRKHASLNYKIVTFGTISEQLKSEIEVPAIHLGKLYDTKKLKNLYSACDVFLGPSKMEAFGKTMAEASACGLPVIAYDYGGPKDIVINGQNGFLIKPFDEDAFVRSAIELCSNEEIISALGLFARRTGIKQFNSSALAQQHIELYSRLSF